MMKAVMPQKIRSLKGLFSTNTNKQVVHSFAMSGQKELLTCLVIIDKLHRLWLVDTFSFGSCKEYEKSWISYSEINS